MMDRPPGSVQSRSQGRSWEFRRKNGQGSYGLSVSGCKHLVYHTIEEAANKQSTTHCISTKLSRILVEENTQSAQVFPLTVHFFLVARAKYFGSSPCNHR
uniref:Predicted protein n=1 Tax=Hordeum vulgare subsp. vulgare TaxID=112509 RepID=F2D4A7_HORVV|nr:predicted protein [Hordeum vulgare subsp. vulgare]